MSSDHGGFRLFNARDKKAETVIVVAMVASRATIEGTIGRAVSVDFSDTEIPMPKSCERISREEVSWTFSESSLPPTRNIECIFFVVTVAY